MAVRTAIESGRRRIVRQIFVECAVLAAAGGIGGVGVAVLSIRLVRTGLPIQLPVGADIHLSETVLLFSIACCVGAAIMITTIAAWRSASFDCADLLRTRRQGYWPRQQRMARLLLGSQTALAVVLLFAAALLMESAARIHGETLGFRVDGRFVVPLGIPPGRYGDSTARSALLDRTASAVAAVPGVSQLAFVNSAIPRTFVAGLPLTVWGRPVPAADAPRDVTAVIISPSYFGVLQVPLLEGRTFDSRDTSGAEPVAVVN